MSEASFGGFAALKSRATDVSPWSGQALRTVLQLRHHHPVVLVLCLKGPQLLPMRFPNCISGKHRKLLLANYLTILVYLYHRL